MGLLSIVGRASFGLAADRIGGPLAATISYGCTGVWRRWRSLALDSDRRAGWLVAYALLFGLGFGARGPIITAMASDLFGGRRFGVIYGALSVGNGIGGAIGPWFGGVVHDVMGSYRVVFLTSVVFCAVGSACFWLAGSVVTTLSRPTVRSSSTQRICSRSTRPRGTKAEVGSAGGGRTRR